MTDKKRRQRGTRTHGGGTQKNRRGAGNRGGRGEAGRRKHEFHGKSPLGKTGFTRPPELQEDVVEVDLQTLDEEAPFLAASGVAEETEYGYRIDARDVVEDGHAADVVKVLGSGQVRHQLEVVADDFTDAAAATIEAEGGDAVLSDRGQTRAEEAEEAKDDNSED